MHRPTMNQESETAASASAPSFGYTGDGLRAWKQDSGGATVYFLYDGETALCEMDGNVTAVETFGARYSGPHCQDSRIGLEAHDKDRQW